MNWLLSRIANNPMVLGYVAAACFVAGLASGAAPAWKVQGWRLDALRAHYASFVEQTKLIGEQAEKEAMAKAAQDKQLKERYDAQHKKDIAANADLAKRLLNARSSSSYLPAPAPTASDPNRACFSRSTVESALQRFDAGVSGLIAEGDAARIGLDTAKSWARQEDQIR